MFWNDFLDVLLFKACIDTDLIFSFPVSGV